jgi:dihydroorotase
VVRAAFEQDFFPDTITTDLTANNVINMTIDLPTTINKYLALGMELAGALLAVTSAPARLFPSESGIGCLDAGAPADIALFALEEGEFSYDDYYGNNVTGSRRLAHKMTIKDGVILKPEPQPPAALEWGFVKR